MSRKLLTSTAVTGGMTLVSRISGLIRDMAFASLGAVLAMAVTLGFNRAWQRDFAAEWSQSLRVKHRAPLGEEALERMLDGD